MNLRAAVFVRYYWPALFVAAVNVLMELTIPSTMPRYASIAFRISIVILVATLCRWGKKMALKREAEIHELFQMIRERRRVQ